MGLNSCALVQEAFPGVFDKPPRERQVNDEEELDAVVGNRVWDPYKQRWVTREGGAETLETIDTASFREVTSEESPPITEAPRRDPFSAISRGGRNEPAEEVDPLPEGRNRQVTLLLPFLSSTFDPEVPAINPNATWALHYYAGAELALDSLESEGISLEMNVLDSEGDPSVVGNLIASDPGIQQSDLLIGPYRRDNVRLLAPFAKQWQTPLVSPYTASDDITSDNPWYIQVSPALSTHCQQLTWHAMDFASPDQMVLVSRDDPAERSRLAYFQEAYFFRQGTRSVPPLDELIVEDESADLNKLNISPYINRGSKTVFLIPVTDETFVYSFLRKLELIREPEDEIRVYGLPQWLDFEYVDPQYLSSLQVHVSSNFYVDSENPAVKHFRRKFILAYGQIPRPEAYLGFDVMYYFGKMLYYYGTEVPFEMTGRPARMLHTQFRFEPVVIPTTTGAENLPVERYENRYLHILKYQDYRFAPAN